MAIWKKTLSARVKVGQVVGSKHSRGYAETKIDGNRMFLHQAAWLYMTGEWPAFQIDHANGRRNDNRWANLRRADQNLNSANMRRRSSNKSGYKGVVRYGESKFVSYIHVMGKTKYLGTYSNPEDAHAAYMSAAKAAWGEYARAS